MSELQDTEVVMRYIIINIGELKCDFKKQCLGRVKQVYVSKLRSVRITCCSISGYREQHEQSLCDLQCSF